MESAALYAFAEARNKDVICLAHVTNKMAHVESDCEKEQRRGAGTHWRSSPWLHRPGFTANRTENEMRVFDSGMPEEAYWNSLFDVPLIVDWLNLKNVSSPIVEIGCGYGTFTIPVARETNTDVYAFDIELSMIAAAKKNAEQAGVRNVKVLLRDVVEEGTGSGSEIAGMVLLFNILHFDGRRILLAEASRLLKPNGVIAIIHWRKDIETPRGPSVESRPDQQMILESVKGLDLTFNGNSRILEPYHWGIQLVKASADPTNMGHPKR